MGVSIPNCLAYEAGAEALPLWEEIWPRLAMKLVGPLAARSPGLRLALALEIERNCSADEILQGRLIDLVAHFLLLCTFARVPAGAFLFNLI